MECWQPGLYSWLWWWREWASQMALTYIKEPHSLTHTHTHSHTHVHKEHYLRIAWHNQVTKIHERLSPKRILPLDNGNAQLPNRVLKRQAKQRPLGVCCHGGRGPLLHRIRVRRLRRRRSLKAGRVGRHPRWGPLQGPRWRGDGDRRPLEAGWGTHGEGGPWHGHGHAPSCWHTPTERWPLIGHLAAVRLQQLRNCRPIDFILTCTLYTLTISCLRFG